MGMSGKDTFTFGTPHGGQSGNNFGGMGMSGNDMAGTFKDQGTFNFGGLTKDNFAGMSTATFANGNRASYGTQMNMGTPRQNQQTPTMTGLYGSSQVGLQSRQASMSQFGSLSNFGRQRAGTINTPTHNRQHTHQAINSNSVTGKYGLPNNVSTPTAGYTPTFRGQYSGTTPKYGTQATITPQSTRTGGSAGHEYRPSTISMASGFKYGMRGIDTPITPEANTSVGTPNFGSLSQQSPSMSKGGNIGGLSGMGGSFSKFQPMDSPQLANNDSAKFDFDQGASFSMLPNQKHDNL